MRRWLTPAIAATAAAILTLALVGPRSLPPELLRLFADQPPERASTATLIDGGHELDLEVTHGNPGVIAARLALAGLEIIDIDATHIAVRGPALTHPGALAATNIWLPFKVRVGALVTPDAIAEVRRHGNVITIVPVDPAILAAADTAELVNPPGDWYRTACTGARDGDAIVFRHCDGSWVPLMPERLAPARDGAVQVDQLRSISPSVSAADVWSARALIAAGVAALVFALLAVAAGRRRRRVQVAAASDDGGSRARVAGAAALAIAVIAVGLIRGDPGPFIDAIHAGLLGVNLDGTSPLELGYFAVATGLAAAMLATLLTPGWRPDLRGDRDGGGRLLRRGRIFTLVAAAVLFAAPLVDPYIDVEMSGWTAGNTAIYSATALGLIAVVLAVGSRAIGGAWVCAALAVLIPACARVAGRLGDEPIAAVALGAAVCTATASLLIRSIGRDSTDLRAPIGGVLPASIGAGVAALLAGLAGGLPLGERLGLQISVAIPIALAAALFELRARRGLGSARVASTNGASRAIAVSLLYVAVLLAADGLARHLYSVTFAVLAALTTAALMDASSELRARWRRPGLTGAWHVHQPQLAGLIERALDGRGLSCHMRGQYLRTCLGIFGPFVPITVLVDRDRVAEARELIRSVLS